MLPPLSARSHSKLSCDSYGSKSRRSSTKSVASRRSSEGSMWETGGMGQRAFAHAAAELAMEARDGIRTDGQRRAGSLTARGGRGTCGVTLDLDTFRRGSFRSTFAGELGCQSAREQPRDVMASGPQHLQMAAAPGPRKGVHHGISLAKLTARQKEEAELRMICETIGVKAAQKFGTVRQAFRYLDSDHDGKISRSEMRYFFRAYNFDERVADKFFDRLDRDGSGEIDYGEFMKFVAPYVQPDHSSDSCQYNECDSEPSTRTPSPHGSTPDASRPMDSELRGIFEFIGKKASEKFSNAREVFRRVDTNDDGTISRGEMQCFFRVFNLTATQADRFFDYMDVHRCGEVDYHSFVKFLGPFLELMGTNSLMHQKHGGYKQNHPSRRSSFPTQPSLSSGESEYSDGSGERSYGCRPPVMSEKEMRGIMKDIGEKLPLNFKHVRDAFRPLDLERNGKIKPTEMRHFLRGFGWTDDVADKLFKALDEDNCGVVDFNEFLSHFETVLGPANRLSYRQELVPETDEKLVREVNQLAAILREKLLTKYGNARRALSDLDLEGRGLVTLSEIRRLFLHHALPLEDATKVFKYLRKDNRVDPQGTVPLEDFLTLFGPTSGPGGRWRTVQELEW